MEGAATGPEQHAGGETDGGGSEDQTATCVHNRQEHLCAESGAAGSGKGADKEQEVQGAEPGAARRGPYAKVRGPYKKKTCPSCGNRVKKCVCAHNIGLSVPGYCWWSLPLEAMTTARPPSFDPASEPAAARRGRKRARADPKSAASCTGASAPAAPLPGSSAAVQAPGEKTVSAGESALTPSQPPPPPLALPSDAAVDP